MNRNGHADRGKFVAMAIVMVQAVMCFIDNLPFVSSPFPKGAAVTAASALGIVAVTFVAGRLLGAAIFRRRWRIGVSTLLLSCVSLAIALAWLRNSCESARRQRLAANAIESRDGSVYYEESLVTEALSPLITDEDSQWLAVDFFSDVIHADDVRGGDAVLLKDFPRLEQLSMKWDDDEVAELPVLPRLVFVDLGNRQHAESIFRTLRMSHDLAFLRASQLAVTSDNCENLSFMASLTTLDLDGADVLPGSMRKIASLPRMMRLILTNTSIDDNEMADLIKGSRIRALDLQGTCLSKSTVCKLATLESLEYLWLDGVPVDDKCAEHLGRLKLKLLTVSDSNLTDYGLQQLCANHRLEALGVSGTKITDDGLRHLLALDHLRELCISRTSISDKGVTIITNVHTLVSISIEKTNISAAGIDTLRERASLDGELKWQGDTRLLPPFED